MGGYSGGRLRALRRLIAYEESLRLAAEREAYARELVGAAGLDWDEWLELPVLEQEAVLARGKRALRKAGKHP